MVKRQIEARGIHDPGVLEAMRSVPRDLFIPHGQDLAWSDQALPIGWGQTISQPYIVALMTSLLAPRPGDRILEVGTGSGYQAAVLSQFGAEIDTVEIIPSLAREAAERLSRLGFNRVHVRGGDGSKFRSEGTRYDGIIVTCATNHIPENLSAQLKTGGRMVLPLGRTTAYQELTVATRRENGKLDLETVTGVVFVPMTGPNGMARTPEALA